ncbi:restriction endonuclease subunit S [Serratia marcescens]|uniref:restriction endonuclease subunit S n=1 Tax=Serratia marcescens TaxID=615 RepID=UPI00066803A6|nr:restriction endonuclease subunit S [Serratia marcescens]
MSVEKLITDHIDIWSSALQTRSSAGRGSNGKIDLYGIKKLRELILELAVRGKLVPQDPNDEPASELLKRIAAEKAELVKQGKIKKQKPLPEISEDEKPFELPEGWEWGRLGDAVEVINGRAYKKQEMLQSGTPLLRVGNLFTSNEWYYSDLELDEDKYIDRGDLIYAWSASFGPFIWQGDKVIYHYHIWKLKIFSESSLSRFFLHDYLASITEKIKSQGNGIAMLHMTKERMEKQVIAFPPLEEQINIVSKIKELMSLCDQLEHQALTSLDAHQQLVETLLATLTNSQNAEQLVENWTRISQHFDTLFTTEASIDALKQTILQLAVMGKLVPQDPNDEPASELLKHIEQEKAQLVKEGKIKKQKPLPPVSDEEKPFELPIGWVWCRLPDLGELARGKSKHRPRNDPALYSNGNCPLVQTGDVSRSNGVIKTYTALYNELGVKQSRIWPRGTLCITIAANIADSGILEFDACFPDSVVGYSPFFPEIPVKYFDIYMRTMKASLEKYAPSTAQKNINLDILSQVLVPCPPLNEFERIVEKVDVLFSIFDTLKSRLQSAQQTQLHLADALTDAALN